MQKRRRNRGACELRKCEKETMRVRSGEEGKAVTSGSGEWRVAAALMEVKGFGIVRKN